jgi:hypothetical protein
VLGAFPGKRAELLAPHKDGFVAGIVPAQLADIRRLRPVDEPVPLPPTIEEMIAQLPGGDPSWDRKVAELLAQDFGTAKDRKLWTQFERIALAVRIGRLDPAPVLNAYRQAMQDGIKNRGGKFWGALQCLAEIDAHGLKDLTEGRS